MDKNHCIGVGGDLPWHIKGDLQYFKAKTLGKPIIMGRKTFDSLPGILPKRTHIVITRTLKEDSEMVKFVTSLDDAIAYAETLLNDLVSDEVMVVGGGQIYKQAIEVADRLYITRVDTAVDGDTFFPNLDKSWQEIHADGAHKDEKTGLDYTFFTYEKR